VSTRYQNITGTFDILPEAYDSGGTRIPGAPAWQYVESTIREVMGRYHYEEIRTPILEPTDLIARGIGELTDIVTKEMFAFERGDTRYVLRPEVTAPVMRAFLQHHLEQRGGVQKLFYIGPCFRAEKPQKGRYRQFHQFGVEIIGAETPRADAESIDLMMACYAALGIQETRLRINTIGDVDARQAYIEALENYLEPYRDDLSDASQRRLVKNPLRILDTKLEHEREILEGAPLILDYVSSDSRAHYDQVKERLADLQIPFDEDPFLVRGLDYYTETAYEVDSTHLGAQSALGGGGRYDLLASELGSDTPVPAVGFAAGFERMFLALEAEAVELPGAPVPDVFIVALGEAAREWAFVTARDLRDAGVDVHYDLKARSMRAQMREADRQQVRFAVIVGDQELEKSAAAVKQMETGEQVDVPFDQLAQVLQRGELP
jgi:histidyl-tRNA synthetase